MNYQKTPPCNINLVPEIGTVGTEELYDTGMDYKFSKTYPGDIVFPDIRWNQTNNIKMNFDFRNTPVKIENGMYILGDGGDVLMDVTNWYDVHITFTGRIAIPLICYDMNLVDVKNVVLGSGSITLLNSKSITIGTNSHNITIDNS